MKEGIIIRVTLDGIFRKVTHKFVALCWYRWRVDRNEYDNYVCVYYLNKISRSFLNTYSRSPYRIDAAQTPWCNDRPRDDLISGACQKIHFPPRRLRHINENKPLWKRSVNRSMTKRDVALRSPPFAVPGFDFQEGGGRAGRDYRALPGYQL